MHHRRMRLRSAAFASLLALALSARAQDLAAFLGSTRTETPRETTYGWLLQYSHDLGEHLFATYSYMNEGHVPRHHRDGHAVQLWLGARPFSPELTFSSGIGPYRFFDTTVAESGDFANAHGWGWLASVAATWRPGAHPWFYELRVNRVEARNNIDSTMVLLGVGYRAEQDATFARGATDGLWKDRRGEVWLARGETIVNSLESESQNASAWSIEYRHAFTPVVRGSVGWVQEGDARLIRRGGVVAQGWLEPSFSHNLFTVGIGFGGYFAVDEYQPRSHRVLGILSTTLSYHFAHNWVGRFTWHRISSNYDRDSDIALLGVGYRF